MIAQLQVARQETRFDQHRPQISLVIVHLVIIHFLLRGKLSEQKPRIRGKFCPATSGHSRATPPGSQHLFAFDEDAKRIFKML